jgi:hypothetical protein
MITRRQFLKASALAGAALLDGYQIMRPESGSRQAQEEQKL